MKNTKKKVDVFHLSDEEEKREYEELINDEDLVYIIKEEFHYDKYGKPIITIFYEMQNYDEIL